MDKLIIIPVTSDQSIELMLSLANEIWGEFFGKNPTIAPIVVSDVLEDFTFATRVKNKIKKGHYFIVQNIRKENIGYCGMYDSNKILSLDVIAIKVEYRGKRYGKRMLRVIEFLSRKYGYSCIATAVHAVNSYAVEFFQRNGFISHGTTTEQIGDYPTVIHLMIKDLSGSREKLMKVLEDMKYDKK